MSGLDVWDASGRHVFGTSTRCARLLGQVNTGTGNGSINDGRLTEGTPFFQIISTAQNTLTYVPAVTFSGSTLSWTWPGSLDATYHSNCVITYGVFA